MFISASFDEVKRKSKGFLSYLLCFFSRKDVSVICFILAIVIKTLLTYYFQRVDGDKLYQAMAGKNFVEGHGLTIKQVHANNLSKELYEPLAGWPPGYSFLIGFFYLIVNDINTACLIIDVILVILYLIILRKLCNQLAFPPYLSNLTILFYGATISPGLMSSVPTDFLTLILSIYNCSLAITIFKKKNATFEGVQLAIFNSLAVWFRYVYLPVTFVIPAFILLNAWFKKDRRLLKYGLFILLTGIVSTAVLLSFQVPYKNLPGYVMVAEKGIYWSNLLQQYPLLFSSFINVNFYCTQLTVLLGIPYGTGFKIMLLISIAPLSVILFKFLKSSFEKKWQTNSGFQTFTMVGGLTSIAILLVLEFMSLTHNADYPLPNKITWTYLSEGRYYLFLEFVIFIIAVKCLYDNQSVVFKLKKPLQLLVLFLLCIEMLHGIYYLNKNFTFDRRNHGNYPIYSARVNLIQNIITEQKKKNVDVVIFNKSFGNRAVLLGGKGLFEPAELNSELHAEKPTFLIAILDSSMCSYYKPFLNKKGVRLMKTIGKLNYFSYHIKTGQ